MKTKYSETRTKMNTEEKTGHKTKDQILKRTLENEGKREIKEYLHEDLSNS